MATARRRLARRPHSWRQLARFPLGRRLWIGTLAGVVPPDTTTPVRGDYVLECDWDGDGDYGDTGEDLTPYLVEVSYRMGRDRPSPLTGRAQAGHLTATLNNDDGRFSPENASSPLYGLLNPGRRLRLRVTAPTVATLITAWTISQPQPTAPLHGHPTATIEAEGPLARMALGFGNVATAGDDVLTLFETLVGSVSADLVGTAEELPAAFLTTGQWGTRTERALVPLRELEDLELGFAHELRDGTLILHSRNFRTTASRATVVQATFSDAPGATLSYDGIERLPNREQIANRIVLQRSGFAVGALAVLWQILTHTAVLNDANGHTASYTASYPAAGSPAGTYVDAWTTPVLVTDVHYTGNAPTVTNVVKRANSMSFDVQNSAGQSTSVGAVAARGTPAVPEDPQFLVAEDATSQAAYGLLDHQVPGLLPYATYADAETAAALWLARFKDPHALVAISFAANRHSLAFTEAVSRRLSDRIHVTATGARTKLGIDGDFWIEAISGRIDVQRRHTVRFELSGA